MTIIERYIDAVIRHLPEKQRQDVARELRAEIEAMTEDEAKGKQPNDKHAFAVLKRLGDPVGLAGQYYEQERYLISPRFYDVYVSLLKTLLAVTLPIVAFFVATLKLSTDHKPVGEALINAIVVAFEVGIHITFWTTATLVIIDRFVTAKNVSAPAWTPEQLPELPQAYQISKREAFIGATWSIFGMALLITQIPVIHNIVQPDMPLFFASDVRPWWLAGFIVILACNLAVELLKLHQGGWTKVMVTAITGVNVLSVIFFVALLTLLQPIANPEFTDRIQQATNGANVANATEMGVRVIGLLIISILLWEIVGAWLKYKKGRKDTI